MGSCAISTSHEIPWQTWSFSVCSLCCLWYRLWFSCCFLWVIQAWTDIDRRGENSKCSIETQNVWYCFWKLSSSGQMPAFLFLILWLLSAIRLIPPYFLTYFCGPREEKFIWCDVGLAFSLWEGFLTTSSVYLIDIGVFRSSISFWVRLGGLYILRNLSILSKL